MVLFEDKELEESVMSGESCIAVPVEIFKDRNGKTVILTYSVFEDAARELEKSFDDLLSEDALSFIDEKIKGEMKKLRYVHMPHEYEFMTEYKLTPGCSVNRFENEYVTAIRDNATLQKLCENSVCDIEMDDGEDDVIYAVVKDGEILSYAGINDLDRGETSVEISVETAPDYMNMGYGSASVSALCDELLKKGKNVLYKTAKTNKPSIALAEKCGFEYTGERYSYYCEKI